MTDLILLGGRNLRQQSWIREVETAFSPYFAATHVLDYQHWKQGTVEEDVPNEAENLITLIESLGTEREYAIFGKSMGMLVTADAIKQGRIHPRFCVFAATPIKYPLSHEDNGMRRIESLFQDYETPTLFIQNPDEKYMKPRELEETLKGFGARNFQVVEGTGGVHSYAAWSLVGLVREYILRKVR